MPLRVPQLTANPGGAVVPSQCLELPSCCPAEKRGAFPCSGEAVANESFLYIPVAVDDFSVLKLVLCLDVSLAISLSLYMLCAL